MTWLAFLILPMLGQQAVPRPSSRLEQARQLRQEARELKSAEGQRLDELARQLEAKANTQGAAEIRALIEPLPSPHGPIHFQPLPEVHRPSEQQKVPPSPALAVQRNTAAAFFELATRAGKPGTDRLGIAAECLASVLKRDPEHAEARRLLGFVQLEPEGWATPQAAENLKAGMQLHPVFGWVPADWFEHLDQGKLPAPRENGQSLTWLDANQADALRSDFMRRPWQISTEHFDIWTNVPLAEAIVFGRRLEAVHQAFEIYLADLIDPAASELSARFQDPMKWAQPDQKRHMVWYFADRDEYTAFAREKLGRDESLSLGYYLDPRESRRYRQPPRSYFYRDPDQSLSALATLFHEASHQILFETAGPTAYDQNIGQFWVWEGLGTYFESFTPREDGSYDLGARVGPRFEKAYDDVINQNLLMPFKDFTAMSKPRFMDERQVYSNYAQAMAWTLFFMHHHHADYRDAFFDYARDCYRGRFRPRSSALKLADQLGVEPTLLDDQLKAYLKGTAAAATP